MNKYWRLPNSNDIVFLRDEFVYYGKPEREINNSNELIEIPKHFNKIPLNDIEKIENKEKSKFLKFYNKNSEEKISIESEKIKSEILEFIKGNFTEFKYWKDIPTNIEYGIVHYFFLVFLLFCFFCSIYFYIGISNGESFPLTNMRVGILHFCLYLAENGVFVFLPVYFITFGLTIYSLREKLQEKGYIETLKRKNN